MNKIPMTAEGYTKLQDELKKLTSEDRPKIIEAIAEARSHGDLSENAEYQYAKEQQSLIEGRIIDLESAISKAEVIDVKSVAGNDIKFGATVEIEDDDIEDESMKTRIRMNYNLLQSTAKMKFFRPCYKRYLTSHIEGKALEITPNYWSIITMLPLAQFEKESVRKVYSESIRSVK